MNKALLIGSIILLGALVILGGALAASISRRVVSISETTAGVLCGAWSAHASGASVLFPSNLRLLGVATISDVNVWAVGVDHGVFGDDKTVIVHWSGTQWENFGTPSLGAKSGLSDIAALSENDIWAVGSSNDHTLIVHWNGHVWAVVSSPDGSNPVGNELRGIAAITPSDIWAVGNSQGSPLALHWDGNRWSSVSVPRPDGLGSGLNSVAGTAGDNVWAVGYTGFGSFEALIMHWDGQVWRMVPGQHFQPRSTDPNESQELASISALSANDIWAVGWTKYFTMSETLVKQWNGTSWNTLSSPNAKLPSSILLGVHAVSASNIWAVGQASNDFTEAQESLVMHWDGEHWRMLPGPHFFNAEGFSKVTASGSGTVWTSGEGAGQAVLASFKPIGPPCGR